MALKKTTGFQDEQPERFVVLTSFWDFGSSSPVYLSGFLVAT